jgi:hypothetical protein
MRQSGAKWVNGYPFLFNHWFYFTSLYLYCTSSVRTFLKKPKSLLLINIFTIAICRFFSALTDEPSETL